MLSEKIIITKPYAGYRERSQTLLQNCNNTIPGRNMGKNDAVVVECERQQDFSNDDGAGRA